jgi:hypothetical protein
VSIATVALLIASGTWEVFVGSMCAALVSVRACSPAATPAVVAIVTRESTPDPTSATPKPMSSTPELNAPSLSGTGSLTLNKLLPELLASRKFAFSEVT